MFDLGSGPATLTSPLPLSSGSSSANASVYTVTFRHNGTQGALAVDGQLEVYGTSQGSLSRLNSQTSLYVGGTDIESDAIPRDITFRNQFVGAYAIAGHTGLIFMCGDCTTLLKLSRYCYTYMSPFAPSF